MFNKERDSFSRNGVPLEIIPPDGPVLPRKQEKVEGLIKNRLVPAFSFLTCPYAETTGYKPLCNLSALLYGLKSLTEKGWILRFSPEVVISSPIGSTILVTATDENGNEISYSEWTAIGSNNRFSTFNTGERQISFPNGTIPTVSK